MSSGQRSFHVEVEITWGPFDFIGEGELAAIIILLSDDQYIGYKYVVYLGRSLFVKRSVIELQARDFALKLLSSYNGGDEGPRDPRSQISSLTE